MNETQGVKKPFHFAGWYIVLISALAGCSISSAFSQFSATAVDLSLKSGLSVALLLTADTVKSAAIVAAMMCAGSIYRRVRLHLIFALAFVCAIVPQLFLPSVSSPAALIFLKILQGLGAVVFPILIMISMQVVQPSQSGFASAVFVGLFNCGGGAGGMIAGFLGPKFGWESSYYVLAMIQAAIGTVWLITVKTNDFRHTSSSSASRRSSFRLLLSPQVWLLILAFLSTTYVLQAVTVGIPLFSMWIGYGDWETAQISSAALMGTLISCLVSGKISDMLALRSQNRAKARLTVLMLGSLLIALASCLFIFLDLSSFPIFYLCVLLICFASSWGLGTFYAILPELYNNSDLPLVTGFAGGVGDIGMPLAQFIVVVMFGTRGLWEWGWGTCALTAAISISACIVLLLKHVSHNSINS
ncbi:MAG TPA: hypothetical protein DHV55_15095 [Clostridiaceae bacterium]|nr:hypothetical protein [Clostridiaceae bacterium]